MPAHNQYQYSEPKRPTNWPKIILITLGIIILIALAVFFITRNYVGKGTAAPLDDETREQIEGLFNNTYYCSSDVYNCGNFTTQSEAQAVFDACGPGDIHRLDADGNGEACEGLE